MFGGPDHQTELARGKPGAQARNGGQCQPGTGDPHALWRLTRRTHRPLNSFKCSNASPGPLGPWRPCVHFTLYRPGPPCPCRISLRSSAHDRRFKPACNYDSHYYVQMHENSSRTVGGNQVAQAQSRRPGGAQGGPVAVYRMRPKWPADLGGERAPKGTAGRY